MIDSKMGPVRLLNLQLQHAGIREEVVTALMRVVDSQFFVLGEEVEMLEREIAAYSGTHYAIGCASGSDALMLALRAAGIGPGDAVLTSAFSFFATAGYVVHAGATPVFCDIDPMTFNIDVSGLEEASRRHSRIRAMMPVHLFGGCADMDPLTEFARSRGWAIIEDGAQSIGAEYKGRRAQSLGDIGCTSFFPSKNLGGYGDGGMMTTDNAGLADELRALRMHGSRVKYNHEAVGWNSRLDALQAAILRVKLKHLDGWTEGRQRNAAHYGRLLRDSSVRPPEPACYQTRHVWNQYVIRCPDRDGLRTYLAELGIGTEIYYPLPLPLQPCFAELGYGEGDFPEAERAAREVLALPVQGELSTEQIQWIGEAVRAYYRDGKAHA